MKIISLFFRLTRWPNLVFFFLTQFLFQYVVLQPVLVHAGISPQLTSGGFALLTASFVLLAAAGYIINDLYDLSIDLVNKPDKTFITKGISKRSAIVWYGFMNVLSIVFGLYVSRVVGNYCIFILVVFCVLALFIYSAWLKKTLLAGNILVAAITAASVLELGCASGVLQAFKVSSSSYPSVWHSIFWLTLLYTGFAFIISLIREIVKDIEDMEGDRKFGCRTMPIVLGIRFSRGFVTGWLIVLTTTLVYTMVYLIRQSEWILPAYLFLLVIFPLVSILKKLFDARDAKDYHRLSTNIKLVMLAGILSMLFIRYIHFLQ